MLVLAFDTSSNAVTVALVDVSPGSGPAPVERTEIAANRHGELLAPLIESVLGEVGVTARDLAAVAVGIGPGPFTGLRVGIVTAKAMADALGIPVYAEASLDVIASRLQMAAYNFADDSERGMVVMSDARRKQVYWAEYDAYGKRTSSLALASPTEVAAAVAGRLADVAGAGALLYREQFADFTVVESSPYPQAAELAGMVANRVIQQRPSDNLTPLYLRRPDAQPPRQRKRVTPV